jgi:hypothetical protein
MGKLVTVRVHHGVGKEEAARRVRAGIGRARGSFASTIAGVEESWAGDDHLDFKVRALGQTVTGTLDVSDSHVDAVFGQKVAARLKKEGTLLLEHK